MRYRTDPGSGRKLSILGFGCMRLPSTIPGRIDLRATEELVRTAVEAGVNYFDTAYLYPGSEEALGAVLARTGLRERVFVASKLPQANCHKADDIATCFSITLERLKTDRVDYYLIHNVTSLKQWERLADMGIEDWIARQKAAGRIGEIGFSFHGSLDEFMKLLDAYGWDFVQIQYNYANERYQAGTAGLHAAAARGLPVFIMEPLLGGRLADRLPAEGQRIFSEGAGATAGGGGLDGGRAAAVAGLRWLWDKPEVTVVLSGMNRTDQVVCNASAADGAYPGCIGPGERTRYDRVLDVFRASFRVPCTGCNYCMPCPQGINIPSQFQVYNNSFTTGWLKGAIHYFMGSGALGSDPHYASDCVRCGRCVRHCPQSIAIPDELKKVRRRLQVPGGAAAMRLVSKLPASLKSAGPDEGGSPRPR